MHNNHKCCYPERRWMQFLILRVVFEEPSYGYEISRKIEELSRGRHKIKSGTMYTTLRRMEHDGLLSSNWLKNKDGPDKRIYRATKKGKGYLKKWLEAIMERKKMVDNMVKFYSKHFGGKNER